MRITGLVLAKQHATREGRRRIYDDGQKAESCSEELHFELIDGETETYIACKFKIIIFYELLYSLTPTLCKTDASKPIRGVVVETDSYEEVDLSVVVQEIGETAV